MLMVQNFSKQPTVQLPRPMITKTVKVKSESQWLSKRRRNHDIGIDD